MKSAPPQILFDTKDTAQMLNLSVRTIWQLKEDGELASIKIGANVKFLLSDIEAFIERKRS